MTLGREACAAPAVPSAPGSQGRLSVFHGGEMQSTFSRECETIKMTLIASGHGELVIGKTSNTVASLLVLWSLRPVAQRSPRSWTEVVSLAQGPPAHKRWAWVSRGPDSEHTLCKWPR